MVIFPLPNSSGFLGARAFTPSTSLIEHKRKVPAVPRENVVEGNDHVVSGRLPFVSCWHRAVNSVMSLSVSSDCCINRVIAICIQWGRSKNHLLSEYKSDSLILPPLDSGRLTAYCGNTHIVFGAIRFHGVNHR